MQKLFKNCILSLLNILAKVRLKRLGLFVIAVTGSAGKTSTKEAVFTILKTRYKVFRSKKSYNSEFGLPLAILEQTSGFHSAFKWMKILFSSLIKAFFGGKNMKILILELGVEKPKDMDRLLKIIQPQVAIITNIKPVHLGEGQFQTLEKIFEEKSKLVKNLPEKGIAILNADDPYLLRLKNVLICKKFYYGFSQEADLKIIEAQTSAHELELKLSYKDETVQAHLPLPGAFQSYIIAAAVSAALTQGLSLKEAINALKDYRLPPGRMNLIAGIQHTNIIDSSYNASPETMKEALEVLKNSGGRRIAVLGTMNELGKYTEEKHREVGRFIQGRTDVLLTLGDSAGYIGDEAGKNGFPETAIHHFDDTMAAAEFLRKILQKDDTILVKGSQNKVRLERLVKMLMKDPGQAQALLARQEEEWQNIR